MCGSKNPSCKFSQKGHSVFKNSVVEQSDFKTGCTLSCCLLCSFCSFTRASTKERSKTRSLSEQNKACQRCMLCKSMPFCPNAPNAVSEQNAGGRLQRFWQVWQDMGANPRVVSILKEGYTLPFKQRPRLIRFPLVQSGYASPIKNLHLKEALLNLMNKLVVEKVVVRSSLAFYNRLFLVPKPNKKWRPILDLSQLNVFLNTGTFKMETPETIRLSLKTGEWITSLDFSDAYFHIPIGQRSRKYLRFCLLSHREKCCTMSV